ncbi:MAG TPA: glycosyltransferase family 4 protein [Gemmatimonadales bacterium]
MTPPQARGPARPHIVLVTDQFPTPSEPERGIFTFQIATRLATLCRLTVVCPLPWFPAIPVLRRLRAWYRFAEVPRAWVQEGVRVIAPKYPMLPKLSEGLHGRLMAARLRPVLERLRRTEQVDLINSHWLYPDGVAVHLAMGSAPLPHVPTGLGCDVNEFLDDPRKGPQIRAMLAAAPAVTVVSNELRARLIAQGVPADRITTIPNGVDATRFHLRDRAGARRRLGLADDGAVVLYVGRLSEEKAPGTLIAAMARLRTTHPSAELLLAGDGPLRRSLLEQARALGLADHVRFLGHQPHDHIAEWMAAADCLCLSSTREGCPNVVLEALASGVPVVATSVGDLPEVITPATGVLVPAGAPAALADGLGTALDRDWDRLAIQRTVASRSWDGVARAYLETFQRTLATRPAPTGGRA